MTTAARPIDLRIIPTSQADLWGHFIYRSTANCFTNAATIGFITGTTFQDANIEYAKTYYYWCAPVDFSFNVGSWQGPAIAVSSFLVTTDVACGAISNLSGFESVANVIAVGVTPTTIGFVTVNAHGGTVLVLGGANIRNDLQLPEQYTLSIHGGNVGNELIRRTSIHAVSTLHDPMHAFQMAILHTPASGPYTYYLASAASAGSYTVADRNLQAIELLR